jgi:hypothetical protein
MRIGNVLEDFVIVSGTSMRWGWGYIAMLVQVQSRLTGVDWIVSYKGYTDNMYLHTHWAG